jgi:hypothetical protein
MPAFGKHNGFYETWKSCELVAPQGRRRELLPITAAMVPAIGQLDLGDDVGMIEDRGILARRRVPPSSSVVMAAPMQPAGEVLCEQSGSARLVLPSLS